MAAVNSRSLPAGVRRESRTRRGCICPFFVQNKWRECTLKIIPQPTCRLHGTWCVRACTTWRCVHPVTCASCMLYRVAGAERRGLLAGFLFRRLAFVQLAIVTYISSISLQAMHCMSAPTGTNERMEATGHSYLPSTVPPLSVNVLGECQPLTVPAVRTSFPARLPMHRVVRRDQPDPYELLAALNCHLKVSDSWLAYAAAMSCEATALLPCTQYKRVRKGEHGTWQ
jgi:hypothetical protein